MRALVLERFGHLVVSEIAMPTPADNEILVRVAATGICGSDLHGYTGANRRRVPGQVMGHESVGTIAELGALVDIGKFHRNQVVTFNPVVVPLSEADKFKGREQHAPNKKVIGVAPEIVASFAEFICVPSTNVVGLPDEMPIVHGALIEPFAVALHAVRRLRPASTDKLLIVGGGPIGQSTILAARSEGVERIIVSEVDERRRMLCASLGVQVIDPSATVVADQVVQLFGEPADICIDAVGTSASLSDALSATSVGGAICLVGMGTPELDIDAYRISTEERMLVGSFTYSAKDFLDAAEWVSSAPEELGLLISREVSLSDGPAAFAALAANDGTPGKVLIRLDA